MTSEYRLAPALFARSVGVLVAATGGLVVLLTLAVALLGLDVRVLSAAVLGAAAVGTVVALLLARRSTPVVRLDEVGYQVRFVRGAGVSRARWTDVEDVVAASVAGERCVVVRLRDGRSTTVPVRILAADPDDFVRDLQTRLDRGHGYRRLRR